MWMRKYIQNRNRHMETQKKLHIWRATSCHSVLSITWMSNVWSCLLKYSKWNTERRYEFLKYDLISMSSTEDLLKIQFNLSCHLCAKLKRPPHKCLFHIHTFLFLTHWFITRTMQPWAWDYLLKSVRLIIEFVIEKSYRSHPKIHPSSVNSSKRSRFP